MTTLLSVQANPRETHHSYSLRLLHDFLAAFKEAHPDSDVHHLNLYRDHVPVVDYDTFSGWGKIANNEELSHTEKQKVDRMGELRDQFMAADYVVVAAPMWNFSYPPMVKAYIDCIVSAGHTFKYEADGTPVGLLDDRPVVLIEARGGIYSEGPAKDLEHTESYMKDIMGLMGIRTVPVIRCEGVAAKPDQAEAIYEKAKVEAEQVARDL
ncbi:azoreductase [Pontibacillus halophilus JSM 076056 = DSM 19796]|uniref:FMN dependent NADH:quinone oxidoreductase n=1 Tax=Pontibacillus halophilus JSM 076056 = DSM 19796 TaxID=1385510 RepID=A0A0A5I9F9_9BACI|nr:FMN-dependent NADH-azoreductase [Pontibacillus halophilus]KGX92467.1 azoreductase [Pontibacillus halophilus JSM 076056 = DSM 19796]